MQACVFLDRHLKALHTGHLATSLPTCRPWFLLLKGPSNACRFGNGLNGASLREAFTQLITLVLDPAAAQPPLVDWLWTLLPSVCVSLSSRPALHSGPLRTCVALHA